MNDIICPLDKDSGHRFEPKTEPSLDKFKGIDSDRIVRIKGRTFRAFLADPNQQFIECMFMVRVCYDTGETKIWSFDSLEWWTREHGIPHVYQKVLDSVIALNRKVLTIALREGKKSMLG